VPVGRTVRVHHADPAARLHREGQVIEQAERLRDLVVHMDQDRDVHAVRRQPRIVWQALDGVHVPPAGIRDPPTEQREVARFDVHGKDASRIAEHRRELRHVVAIAGADVGHHHPATDAECAQHRLRLAERVTAVLGDPAWRHDARHGACRVREAVGGQPLLRSRLVDDGTEREGGEAGPRRGASLPEPAEQRRDGEDGEHGR